MPAEPDPIDVAARALRHRDRSRAQVAERLERAGVEEDRRDGALDALERFGYLDDARFASGRAEAMAGRGFGDEAIRHDLAGAGVAPAAIDEALAGLDPEAERARVEATRLGRTPQTARRLARKGFADESVEAAVGPDVAGGSGEGV